MKHFLTILLMAVAFQAIAEVVSKSDSGVIYSPVGKRDPFRKPSVRALPRDVASISPLERFSLEQLQLKAILRGLGKHRAMFEDPEGKAHILYEGALIGRERATVSKILQKEVIVTIHTFNYMGAESINEKVLSLPNDESEDDSANESGQRRNGFGK